jgi:hypothetical protein
MDAKRPITAKYFTASHTGKETKMVKFEAPNGTPVFWGEAEKRKLKNPTKLNASVQWDGNDGASFLGRYAEGDMSPDRKGSFIVSFGVEQKGGPAFSQVKAFLEAQGETREPTAQEVVDFSIVKFGNSAPPIDKADGSRANPIQVKDPKFPHGFVMEVDGKFYMNDLSAGSKAKSGFPGGGGTDDGTKTEPNYKELVSKVRTRLQAVDLPPGGGKFAKQLRQLVTDLLSIVGKQ